MVTGLQRVTLGNRATEGYMYITKGYSGLQMLTQSLGYNRTIQLLNVFSLVPHPAPRVKALLYGGLFQMVQGD